MKITDKGAHLSATDLSNHQSCRYLTHLNHQASRGLATRPIRHDPTLELLQQRGHRHEQSYLDHLNSTGRQLTDLCTHEAPTAAARTQDAMKSGADAIAQATLQHGRWHGRADVLLRIDHPSDLGNWSYEVVDTKLSQETKGGTVLQLCLYTELVGRIQGHTPTHMHVVKPGKPPTTESFRFDDFGAYYRMVKRRLEQTVDSEPAAELYADPVAHCEICSWWPHCDQRRRQDDHLSFVAGLQALHEGELKRQGIATLQALAEARTPLKERPKRGARETFERLHQQARLQWQGRIEEKPLHELLPHEPGRGLARLPEPSPHDIYFDIESDNYVEDGGLEYLFGYLYRNDQGTPVYERHWATDRRQERQAFEAFIDFVIVRWQAWPDLHVYHFHHYEPTALKRLIGRHGTRRTELDRLLRGERFVDLLAVTRQGLRASVESYSLKDLERFTGFKREVELPDARQALRRVAWGLELEGGQGITDEDRRAVEGYNRDDCLSTAALHRWLEERREDLRLLGNEIERPEVKGGEASEKMEEAQEETQRIRQQLIGDLPEERSAWTEEQEARWLLAHTLEYFLREFNCGRWEYHRLRELEQIELLHERKGLWGLRFKGTVGTDGSRSIQRYEFPEQEAAFQQKDKVYVQGEKNPIGAVIAIDQSRRTLDLCQWVKWTDRRPHEVFTHDEYGHKVLTRSLLALASWVGENGIDSPGPYRAARDLLLRRPPRRSSSESEEVLRREGEPTLEAAIRLARELDHGALAIQGPPGSGKTFTGAHMIVALSGAGKRVGVTAVGHKVIRNLLGKAFEIAREQGTPIAGFHKADPDEYPEIECLETVNDNEHAIEALDRSKVVGGTSYLWARDDSEDKLDYLFVDEAGQFSLAQLLAVGRCAKNLVLLGDPQQLEQPQQGSHPEGSAASALEHLLGDHETIPPEVGLFLDRTWRLHPEICRFTSELYYDGRLESQAGMEKQRIVGLPELDRSALYYVPVEHRGNQATSIEEVDVVVGLVNRLCGDGVSWIDEQGRQSPIGLEEILIVAPYNAHVGALKTRMPEARIGTVDKFQGQEAPVVIYSMASSSAEDAPRGRGFLFNPNRLNVATSRARCVCVLVGAPGLLEGDCRGVREMRWVNGVCRFVEISSSVTSRLGA